MVSPVAQKTPSVGSVVKKMLLINPELSSKDLIKIVRECMVIQKDASGEFSSVEVVDEDKALKLAKEWPIENQNL